MPEGHASGSDPGSESDQENTAPKDTDAELEAAIAAIRGNKDLPRPPYPTLPNMNAPAPMSAKIAAVQAYIEKLSYNFTGVNYFDVRKHRPMGRILETGREVTRQALPIKCVEAVFVAAYLTQGLKELERIPFSFRSQIDGVTYKHIVLAVKHNSKWGSVGLSRRRELYYKDLVYDSLAELFLEYKRSYERVFHTLRRVKVGLPLPHEVHGRDHLTQTLTLTLALSLALAPTLTVCLSLTVIHTLTLTLGARGRDHLLGVHLAKVPRRAGGVAGARRPRSQRPPPRRPVAHRVQEGERARRQAAASTASQEAAGGSRGEESCYRARSADTGQGGRSRPPRDRLVRGRARRRRRRRRPGRGGNVGGGAAAGEPGQPVRPKPALLPRCVSHDGPSWPSLLAV